MQRNGHIFAIQCPRLQCLYCHKGVKNYHEKNPWNLLSILKSFLFLAGEAHLALLSARWGIGMREKGAKNGLLWELKSFILWSWTVLSFWISSSLPFSTIVDCKTGCCAPKSNRKRWPHPQTRAVNLLWLKCGGERRFATFCNHWYFSYFLQLIQYELREVSFWIFFSGSFMICCFYFRVYLNTPCSRVWDTFRFSKDCPLLCCQLCRHLQPRTEKRYCL